MTGWWGETREVLCRDTVFMHVVLTTDNEKQEAAAEAEAKAIFKKRGLPAISVVGDEAAYEFVLLTCSPGPLEFQNQVLRKVR
jgi:hypothetical protein